jgi:hypothetical protein
MNLVLIFFAMTIPLFEVSVFAQVENENTVSWTSNIDTCIISEAVWTNDVVDKRYSKRYIKYYSGDKIVFWSNLKCGAKALEYVKQTKQIPVLMKWYRFFGDTLELDNEKKIIIIKVTDTEVSKIEDEFNNSENKSWCFRIWDFREKSNTWYMIPTLPNGIVLQDEETKASVNMKIKFMKDAER